MNLGSERCSARDDCPTIPPAASEIYITTLPRLSTEVKALRRKCRSLRSTMILLALALILSHVLVAAAGWQ